jgi:hypothetical protein
MLYKWTAISFFIYLAGCAGGGINSSRTLTIEVTGVGQTINEAQKSGFRDAIQEAYGTLTLSERRLTNDSLFEDDVSYARGVIQGYQILSNTFNKTEKNYRLKMRVTVSATSIHRRLLDTQDGQQIDGGKLGKKIATAKAQTDSEFDRYMGARRLFEHISRDIGRSIFDVKVGDVKTIRDRHEVITTVDVRVGTNEKVVTDLCMATKEYQGARVQSIPESYRTNLRQLVVNNVYKCSIGAEIESAHFIAMGRSLLEVGFCIELLNKSSYVFSRTFSKDWKLVDNGWVPGHQFLPSNVKGYSCGGGPDGCTYEPQGAVALTNNYIQIRRGIWGAGDVRYTLKLPKLNEATATQLEEVKVKITSPNECR